ncbi:MAG TPA: TonB C-terminal domain-containing protein [Steroidobacteraceae bacterium]|jgi:protein TonB
MIDKREKRRLAARLSGVLFGALLIASFVWFVHSMMSANPKKPRQVQIVQIIRPPPPPPDQPPPPPPEKAEVPLPKDTPQPKPDEQQPPPDQPLGLDAQGSAGGDAFGLAARAGGSDLIGGNGSAPFAWYTNRIRDIVQEKLTSAACTHAAKGSLSIHLFVEADGRVKQIKLATTTGDQKLDHCVDSALTSITKVNDPAPPGMPEQITMQIAFRS